MPSDYAAKKTGHNDQPILKLLLIVVVVTVTAKQHTSNGNSNNCYSNSNISRKT